MADLHDASSLTTVESAGPEDLDELNDLDGLEVLGEPGAAASAPPDPGPSADPLVRATRLLRTHPVFDGYSGLAPVLQSMHWYDLEAGESLLETDVPRLRRGGVGAQFWSLQAPAGSAGSPSLGATMELIDLV